MRALVLSALILSLAAPAAAKDCKDKDGKPVTCPASAPTVLAPLPGGQGVVGRVDGEKVVVMEKGGTSVAKVGDKKLVCHTTPTGVTICK